MTTKNLEGIEEAIAERTARAEQWRRHAADLLVERKRIASKREQALADAEMEVRAIEQYFADMVTPIDEEIGQVVGIVGGGSETEASAPDSVTPRPAPEPVVPPDLFDRFDTVDEPVAPAPVQHPTAPLPRVVAPSTPRPIQGVVQWAKGLGGGGWVVAIIGAIVAFSISGDHILLRVSSTGNGYWDDIQKIVWMSGWTGLGFYVGGSLGMLISRTFSEGYRSPGQL